MSHLSKYQKDKLETIVLASLFVGVWVFAIYVMLFMAYFPGLEDEAIINNANCYDLKEMIMDKDFNVVRNVDQAEHRYEWMCEK